MPVAILVITAVKDLEHLGVCVSTKGIVISNYPGIVETKEVKCLTQRRK